MQGLVFTGFFQAPIIYTYSLENSSKGTLCRGMIHFILTLEYPEK